MFSGSFVDLSGRHGGYTSYLKWMFPKAKVQSSRTSDIPCSLPGVVYVPRTS